MRKARRCMSLFTLMIFGLMVGASEAQVTSSGGAASPDTPVAAVSLAPANLRASVTGSTVRLDWDAVPEVLAAYSLEAGTAPGLSNVVVVQTAIFPTSIIATNVPAGTYYVRIRAVGLDNVPGPPSNEAVVRVGGQACTSPPLAPGNLSARVIGNQVTLSWSAPSGGDAPLSYIIRAGSAPGLSNVVVFDTRSTATALSAIAAAGVYHARVLALNACGLSAPSADFVINVGGSPTPVPPTPPTPPPTAGTPPTITDVVFPPGLSGVPGSRANGAVSFSDPDADVTRAYFTAVSSVTPFTSFNFDPNVRGRTQGTFTFFIECSRIGPNPGNCSGTTVIEVVLEDSQGNRSVPRRFSFVYQ